jgi:two-component system, sensor histidine kinase
MDTAPRSRLSTAFWRSLVLSTLLPLLVLSLAFYFYWTRVNERRLLDRLEIASSLTSELLENHIQLHLAAVRAEASKAQDRVPDSAGLDRLRALYPSFLTTLRTDALGRVIAVSPPERLEPGVSLDVSDREYFRVPAVTGQPVVTNGFLGRGLGRDELVAVAAPVWVDGRFDGVVEAIHPS